MTKQLAVFSLALAMGASPLLAQPKDKDKDKDSDRGRAGVAVHRNHDGDHDRDDIRNRRQDRDDHRVFNHRDRDDHDRFRRTHEEVGPRASKGKKSGWRNCDGPPGQAKKNGCEVEHRHHGRHKA